MNRTLTTLAVAAVASIAITGQASAAAEPVTVSPKCQDGKIFVQPTPPGLLQINLDSHPAVSSPVPGGGTLNPGGDGISGVGYWIVASEGQHTVRVRLYAQAWGWYYDKEFPVDCGTPQPIVVEVPVDRVVEVPVVQTVTVAGAERVVTKTVTKTKRVVAHCLRKVKNGKTIFYNCRNPVAKKIAPKRPGAKVNASRTKFTG